MTRSRFAFLVLVFGVGCGGRTLLPGESSGLGASPDGGSSPDAPIVGEDGPISTTDGSISSDAITPPEDVIIPPPPPPADSGFDGTFVDGSFDGGFDGNFDGGFDSGFDGTLFDGGLPDGFGFDGTVPVMCGATFCFSGEECCVTLGGGGPSASCVPTGTCSMGVGLSCTGSDNCSGGEVCCGSIGSFGGGGASCQPAPCGMGSVELCTGDGICPPGEMCISTPLGLSVCRP